MAIPVARVHLAMAHAALPALLPTPPKWKMLPLLPTPPCPCPCVAAAILPKPLAKPKPSRADSYESVRSSENIRVVHGSSSPRKSATSAPPPKPGRADSVERWDAHKKAASPALSSSLSPCSGTSSLVSSCSKWLISRATSSAERWDVHKERRRPPQADHHQRLVDDGESSSTAGSGDDDIDTEEEILWKPRAMYAGPGFLVAAPESSVLPVPTAFLVPVA
ncbi:hypothetical protein BDA96_05G139500 [Sorghum bicolor]|uniref:Uncharacterized protein n=2 Tax=Sorghum bicolor TaxID=4558 RepID=C5Y2U0_SORBI|nr:hypothetical protein SORBI_3005G127600 [Sorghum bicolor]KAG0529927.1 hypothetical protein BDA96_05G139500 [Sorghum bicolor]